MALRTTAANGSWTTGSTWVGGVAPGAGDRVFINNHAITGAAGPIGTSPAMDAAGTGTVGTGGVLSSTLSGSGTAFTTQLSPGCFLKIGVNTIAAVESIASDTSLTLNKEVSVGAGAAFTFTPLAIYQTGTAARLTLSGGLTVRGPWAVHYPSTTRADVVTIAAGAGVEFDASAAPDPANTHYPFIPFLESLQASRVVINGTAGNRAYWRSNASGGNSHWEHFDFFKGGYLYARHFDFTRLGTATQPALIFDTILAASCFDLANGIIDGCGTVSRDTLNWFGDIQAGAICSIVDCTFRNPLGSVLLELPGAEPAVAGEWVLKGVVARGANVRAALAYWTVGGPGADWCFFDGPDGIDTIGHVRPASTLFQQVLKRKTKSANMTTSFVTDDFTCPGTIEDCYILSDLNADEVNSHPCPMNSSVIHDVLRCVFESVKDDPPTDIIQAPPGAATPGTWNVKFNIKLPNSIGKSSGTFTFGGGADMAVAFEHNTWHLGSVNDVAPNDGTGGVGVGEGYPTGHAGMIDSYRGNLVWDQQVPAHDFAFDSALSTSADLVEDVCAPGDFQRNAIVGAATGTHNRIASVENQSLYGIDYLRWSAAPAGPTLTTAPQFVWQIQGKAVTELGIAGWAASLGATGTLRQRLDHALDELAKRNDPTGYDPRYNLPDLLAYVQDLHRPTHPDYAGYTSSIDASGLTDAAGNALAGTPGAMAYQAAVPSLDISGWEAAIPFALTHYPGTATYVDGPDHYDVVRTFYRIRDYLAVHGGDTAPWDSMIVEAVSRNRDGRMRPLGGNEPGRHAWNRGLARDYYETGNLYSRAAAILPRRFGAGNGDWISIFNAWPNDGARENGFAILNHLTAEDLGHPTTGRVHELAAAEVDILGQWTTPTPRPYFLYVRPFMVGLTCEALIAYWDRYRDHPDCPPGIPAAIKSVLDWVWDHMWSAADGAFPYTDRPTSTFVELTGTVSSVTSASVFAGDTGLSTQDDYYIYGLMVFTSGPAAASGGRYVRSYAGSTRTFTLLQAMLAPPEPGDTFRVFSPAFDTGDMQISPALNPMIAPAYAWYYLHSGDDTYRARHDAIFSGMPWTAYWDGGVTQQKVFNEDFRWSIEGLTWRSRAVTPWPAATALTFTAVDTPAGQALRWSGRLKVALSGSNVATSGPVTLTFSDGGAGGTFRGGSVLSADHPYVFVNYRPPAGSSGTTITLSVTNDGGLTNPASLTYTVSGVVTVSTGYTLTGPTAGPLDAPSGWFTLALTPPNSVPPADWDVTGGQVTVQLIDYTWNGGVGLAGLVSMPGPNESFGLEGCTLRYGLNVPLADGIASQRFTYTARTATGDPPGPFPAIGAIRWPVEGHDPAVWSEPPYLLYTAPAPVVGGRLRLRTAAGALRLRVGGG